MESAGDWISRGSLLSLPRCVEDNGWVSIITQVNGLHKPFMLRFTRHCNYAQILLNWNRIICDRRASAYISSRDLLPPQPCFRCLSQKNPANIRPLVSSTFMFFRRDDRSLADVCVFFLSTHQMNQIRPYVCQESAENGLAGVTLSNNSPAPLYIHQSAVSYLGQLYTWVFEGLGVPDTFTPNSSALTP